MAGFHARPTHYREFSPPAPGAVSHGSTPLSAYRQFFPRGVFLSYTGQTLAKTPPFSFFNANKPFSMPPVKRASRPILSTDAALSAAASAGAAVGSAIGRAAPVFATPAAERLRAAILADDPAAVLAAIQSGASVIDCVTARIRPLAFAVKRGNAHAFVALAQALRDDPASPKKKALAIKFSSPYEPFLSAGVIDHCWGEVIKLRQAKTPLDFANPPDAVWAKGIEILVQAKLLDPAEGAGTDGTTPFMNATTFQCFRLAEALGGGLALAQITAADRYGITALLRAAGEDGTHGCEMLARLGVPDAALFAPSPCGRTMLGEAASAPSLSAARWLLGRGASIDAPDAQGLTPLMRASIQGFFECADFLIRRGARADLIIPGNIARVLGLVDNFSIFAGRSSLDALRRHANHKLPGNEACKAIRHGKPSDQAALEGIELFLSMKPLRALDAEEPRNALAGEIAEIGSIDPAAPINSTDPMDSTAPRAAKRGAPRL